MMIINYKLDINFKLIFTSKINVAKNCIIVRTYQIFSPDFCWLLLVEVVGNFFGGFLDDSPTPTARSRKKSSIWSILRSYLLVKA